MARTSLANSHANLNLSRRKTAWLQENVKVGNRMAETILQSSNPSDEQQALAVRWNELIVELVEMML